jgi:hypothetical protein
MGPNDGQELVPPGPRSVPIEAMEKQLRLRARVSRPFDMNYIGIQNLTKYYLQDIESRTQDNVFHFTYSYTTLLCTQPKYLYI